VLAQLADHGVVGRISDAAALACQQQGLLLRHPPSGPPSTEASAPPGALHGGGDPHPHRGVHGGGPGAGGSSGL